MYFACWSKTINIEKKVLYQIFHQVHQVTCVSEDACDFCKNAPERSLHQSLILGICTLFGGENWKVSKNKVRLLVILLKLMWFKCDYFDVCSSFKSNGLKKNKPLFEMFKLRLNVNLKQLFDMYNAFLYFVPFFILYMPDMFGYMFSCWFNKQNSINFM